MSRPTCHRDRISGLNQSAGMIKLCFQVVLLTATWTGNSQRSGKGAQNWRHIRKILGKRTPCWAWNIIDPGAFGDLIKIYKGYPVRQLWHSSENKHRGSGHRAIEAAPTIIRSEIANIYKILLVHVRISVIRFVGCIISSLVRKVNIFHI